MNISCHHSFAPQGPKPAVLAGAEKFRCFSPIYWIWLPWNHKIWNPSHRANVVCLLNVVWAKYLVSGRLPKIQPCCRFCWGSSEPASFRSHILKSSELLFLSYQWYPSLAWYIFLPVLLLEQATVTEVLYAAGGCWGKTNHCYWGRRDAVPHEEQDRQHIWRSWQEYMHPDSSEHHWQSRIQSPVLPSIFHLVLNPIFPILMKMLSLHC